MGHSHLTLLLQNSLGRPSATQQECRGVPSLHPQACFPKLRQHSFLPLRQAQTPICPGDKHLARQLRHLCRAASVIGKERQQEDQNAEVAEENGHQPHQNGANGAHAVGEGAAPELWDPEAFTLEPGVLSAIDRTAEASTNDVFRCSGCTLTECQGPGGCAKMEWRTSPGGYLRQILTARVYDVAVETPLTKAEGLSRQLGVTVLLKREDLQPVFSFKCRGAYNKMAALSPEQLERGVICSSAGNHAQGVALAARQLKCNATICMPTTTPEIKVNAVKALGGVVELVGDSYSETQTHAQARAAAEGLVFVAPYDDPYVIAGQGTVGAEIVRQCTTQQLESLEAVFVAIGGGGLAAGIATYIKSLHPHIKIIGVEPCGANAMAISLAQGRRVCLSKVDNFADGVAVKQVGSESFRLCRELLDGVVLVDNRAISSAIKAVYNETRSIIETAGACAVAGAEAYIRRHNLKGGTVVAVTSGANINFDRLRVITELVDVGLQQEAMLATAIPEQPGSFQKFIATALSNTQMQVTECKYRYSAGERAHILWGVGYREPAELASLVERLHSADMPTMDLTAIEPAQLHLRHLVGGRARSFMGALPHERLLQVEFPERSGALRRFLDAVSPRWDVTLFHYRNAGAVTAKILIGIQIPPQDAEDFARAQAALADEFTFTELTGVARQTFDMFIS